MKILQNKTHSLFPYQIKRIESFYNRHHPKNAHPDSPKFKKYWKDFIKKSVEGVWVNDEGTWIYMMPKLFFYVNFPLIADRNRDDIHPDLRDNEWIIFTYFLCLEGFSGFELDSEYTCHDYVRRFEENPEALNFIELNKIPKSAKKEDGTYKKYVDPWYYLTQHYLLDNPSKEPLGHALYENQKYNGCILSARGVGKAMKLDELVRVKGGWTKIKDLKVGDFVYGGDGKLTKVKAVHDHELLPFCKLTFRDGREIEVCEDHLWKVWDKYAIRDNGKRGDWVVKDTKSMLRTYKNRRIDSKYKKKHGEIKYIEEYRYAIPLAESLKDEDSAELPIDPYVLGTRSDTKFIPKQYLYSSEDQKLELLKGLMDTDGWSSKRGIVEYYTVSDQLADDFVNLVRSLGIGCSRSVKKTSYKIHGEKKRGKDCHRIRLTTDKAVFKLERKLGYLNHEKSKAGRSRYDKTFIVNVERANLYPGRCITVDNEDHTYITKDYIVTHNSFTTFVGDFFHEWITGGVKRVDELSGMNKRLLFGMGSATKPQLQRSINNVKAAYYNMPGQYKFKDPKKSPYLGPLFKKVQGTWEVGGEVNHIVKTKSRNIDIQGNSLQMVALTKDRTKIGAGDRFRRIYIEEFGFLENAIDVHGSNKDSLQSEGERVGSAIYLGTGGDMNAIRQPKEIFEHPEAYDIFGIPNYWKNPNKKVGLFIPKVYALRDYKDENGNTYIDMAYDAVIKKRESDKKELDSVSYDLEIMFNPLVPEEMLRPGNSSILPKQEAQNQLNNLEAYEIFRRRAQIGRLSWDPLSQTGVKWDKDMSLTLRPILETRIDDTTTNTNKEGAVIIYEQPPDYIPDNLYWVVYDPAAKSGDGESFHSILVYKYFYSGSGEKTYYDTIVAEWIGRKERLDDNYQEVIKLAKYFNAKIFPEINVAGFVEYCRKNNYWQLLEGDAYNLEQEIHGRSAISRSYYKVGFQMNRRKKNWCLKKLRDWLLEVKEIDPISNVPIIRTMDWILSPRILNEIIEYIDDPQENFDHISSLLGLMLLIGKLDDMKPVDLDYDEKEIIKSELIPHINYTNQKEYTSSRRRHSLLNY